MQTIDTEGIRQAHHDAARISQLIAGLHERVAAMERDNHELTEATVNAKVAQSMMEDVVRDLARCLPGE